MDNPVLTPERLAAAQAAARQRLLRQQARAAGTPVAAAAPPPPRPPTLRERMKGGGIVPLDELLAKRDEIIAATAQERERIAQRSQQQRDAYDAARTAFVEQKPAFDELCTIQAQLAEALGRRHRDASETQTFLEGQIELRAKNIAKEIHDSWHAVDEASRVVAAAQNGQHFGHLSYVLEAAVRYGFWERIEGKRYEQMSHRDRKRAILNRGQRYFPVERPNVLHELVNECVRALYRRAIDAAEAERPLQFAMLESGLFPTAFELCDLVDLEQPLSADRQFGCVLVQLAVPKRDGKGSMLVSGVIQLAFTNAEGVGKCISVLAVNGSISKCFPQPVTIPLASLTGSPAVAAIVQHLSDIGDEALFTDEQAGKINEVRRARAKKEKWEPRLVPETDVERQFRFLELAGELWRDRNSKWIERAKAANQKPAALAGSEPVAVQTSSAAGGAPAAAEAGTAPAEKPKGLRKPRGTRKPRAAGGNGVLKDVATTSASDTAAPEPPTGETPAS